MNINTTKFYNTRKNIFDRIKDSNTTTKIFMAFLMACFTGLMSQVIIPLPWSPVPITAQTFAVLTSGLILGKKYGLLSQILYIVLGVAFVPWFAGATGGIDILLGSNCGYFVGFLFASYFIGAISEKYLNSRKFWKSTLLIGFSNFILIYIPGLIGLAIWGSAQGMTLSLYSLLMMGFIPFIFGDILKIIAASSVSKIFLPKE